MQKVICPQCYMSNLLKSNTHIKITVVKVYPQLPVCERLLINDI